MTGLVWTMIGTLLTFTITVIVCNIAGIQIQDSLITAFFTAVGAELATMGGIQITKVKHKKKENSEDE